MNLTILELSIKKAIHKIRHASMNLNNTRIIHQNPKYFLKDLPIIVM